MAYQLEWTISTLVAVKSTCIVDVLYLWPLSTNNLYLARRSGPAEKWQRELNLERLLSSSGRIEPYDAKTQQHRIQQK